MSINAIAEGDDPEVLFVVNAKVPGALPFQTLLEEAPFPPGSRHPCVKNVYPLGIASSKYQYLCIFIKLTAVVGERESTICFQPLSREHLYLLQVPNEICTCGMSDWQIKRSGVLDVETSCWYSVVVEVIENVDVRDSRQISKIKFWKLRQHFIKILTTGGFNNGAARLGVDSVLAFSSNSRFHTIMVRNPTVVPADDLKGQRRC